MPLRNGKLIRMHVKNFWLLVHPDKWFSPLVHMTPCRIALRRWYLVSWCNRVVSAWFFLVLWLVSHWFFGSRSGFSVTSAGFKTLLGVRLRRSTVNSWQVRVKAKSWLVLEALRPKKVLCLPIGTISISRSLPELLDKPSVVHWFSISLPLILWHSPRFVFLYL